VNQVVVLELGPHEKIADDARIRRDFDPDGHFGCPHRGQCMGVRSDPAGSLHEMMGVPRVSPQQYQFDSPEHLPRTPGIHDLAIGHFDLDAQMAFYPCNWVYDDSLRHIFSSLLE
jgi:hypothetical protein